MSLPLFLDSINLRKQRQLINGRFFVASNVAFCVRPEGNKKSTPGNVALNVALCVRSEGNKSLTEILHTIMLFARDDGIGDKACQRDEAYQSTGLGSGSVILQLDVVFAGRQFESHKADVAV